MMIIAWRRVQRGTDRHWGAFVNGVMCYTVRVDPKGGYRVRGLGHPEKPYTVLATAKQAVEANWEQWSSHWSKSHSINGISGPRLPS